MMAKREELFDDPKTVLVRAPYVVGKIDAVRMIGEQLAATGKKVDDTKEFSDEFLEFMKAATRMVNYLSGAFDAIEDVFGKGYAKGVFDRVIDAHQGAKADSRLKRQVDVLRRYFNDPKHNASKQRVRLAFR